MLKTRKIPLRTCVVTKVVRPKKELIRVVANKDGLVSVDLTGKAHGRGAYLLLSKETIDKAIKTKALARKLEVEIPDSVYQQLYELVI